jgi:deoxyribose-phosphate aldolase
MMLTPAALAATLDSTLLRLDATEAELARLYAEAAAHRFAAVMIYPTDVAGAAAQLRGTGVKVGTVIGFPHGRSSTAAKAAEIETARAAGADEVDIVLNYAALCAGRSRESAAEIASLTAQAHRIGALVKIIAETCCLDAAQRLAALRLCEDAGADFIKTSTGFGRAGADVAHLREWAEQRRGNIQLKASGGIKTLAHARAFIEAGAARLGTSNAAAIVAEARGGAPDTGGAGNAGGGY